jgi:hypothetical protein
MAGHPTVMSAAVDGTIKAATDRQSPEKTSILTIVRAYGRLGRVISVTSKTHEAQPMA